MKIHLPERSALRSPDFVFGVATSSFQIEGAADGRLPCIWDTFCATPHKIRDGSDGRVACDHVARWREDVDMMAFLGVDAYRFSISWPRVVGLDGRIADEGVDFYLRLLDGLNERGIKPFATLYHWDLPQHLEDAGGWLNRDTAYRFRDYADLISRALGDRVYSYATLNEPFCSAILGYETGVHAPGRADRRFGKKAAHHLLLAHGLGMQVLDSNRPDTLNGIVLNFTPCYPATDSAADRAAAKAADEAANQWYIKPLIEGRYPDLIDRCAGDEKPGIRDGDMDLISRPLGFLGVNYYTRAVYRADGHATFAQVPPATPVTDMGWEVFPQGLTDLLVSLDRKYDLPPIYVAENGAAMADALEDDEINDEDRTGYMQQHLEATSKAMDMGVDVAGFFYWSLLDNFEWAEGYGKRFGLVYVDFESQRRIIKTSGYAYREFLRNRSGGIEPVAGQAKFIKGRVQPT
ncbi:MAG: GH1 family beta-glucosidase [Woeseiaceae bacterium]